MKNKFIIIIGILLLSLSGISYADVLDNYGTINGTANVSGPEFYICSHVNDEKLLINEKPSSCKGSFGVLGKHRAFKTKEDFGGVDFNYIPKINFQVRAEGTTTSASPVKLGLTFGYYDGTGALQYLATTIFPLSNSMQNYSFSDITASEIPKGIHSFFYEFIKICPPDDDTSCSVSISKCAGGFYTKVGLSK